MDINSIFSQRLSDKASELGYSPAFIAKKLNTSRSAVSKWFNGATIPKAETLTKLAEILECSVSWLKGGPPKQIGDLKPLSLDQLKAIAALAPKDESPAEEDLTPPSGLTLEEQVDILKENRQLRLRIKQLSDYLNSIDRGKNERRRCVYDLKKIINIEEYRDETHNNNIDPKIP